MVSTLDDNGSEGVREDGDSVRFFGCLDCVLRVL
jgi:hypothetical protein